MKLFITNQKEFISFFENEKSSKTQEQVHKQAYGMFFKKYEKGCIPRYISVNFSEGVDIVFVFKHLSTDIFSYEAVLVEDLPF